MESVSAIFCLKVSVSVAKKWYRCITSNCTEQSEEGERERERGKWLLGVPKSFEVLNDKITLTFEILSSIKIKYLIFVFL